ncbi:MAG: cysteine peptidase family C39 domain-containing protein [Methanomicrobiales archaeon]|nr:cysteine peptidase family C39 domain-containing protein [Methanomicrobiales archaeon]
MKRVRLLKQTRQATEYSCGASALQAVLSYWGKDVDEEDLMKILGTNPEVGTYPEDIVRAARSLGFEAEVKENLTVDDVEKSTATGVPVIVLGQAWRSQKDSGLYAADDWADGHYVVALAVDKDYVYLEDPFLRMGKGFLPRDKFEELWHNVMGGDLSKPKQMHVGIFIRGKKPAQAQRIHEIDLSSLDFGKIGTLNLMAVQFRGTLLPYDFVSEWRDLAEGGIIRPDAYIMLRKDRDGRLTVMEGGHLEDAQDIIEINAVVAALVGFRARGSDFDRKEAASGARAAETGDFGLSPQQLQKIGEQVPPDHSAVIILFENLWERRFKEIVGRYHGELIVQKAILPEDLAQLGKELARSGKKKGTGSSK